MQIGSTWLYLMALIIFGVRQPESCIICPKNFWINGAQILKAINVKNIFGLEAYSLMELINDQELECFIVGGAIRDYFLGKVFSDIDLTTNGSPYQIIEILKKEDLEFDERALKYGTISVKFKKKSFQITSFRKDVETFGRHANINFSRDNLKSS